MTFPGPGFPRYAGTPSRDLHDYNIVYFSGNKTISTIRPIAPDFQDALPHYDRRVCHCQRLNSKGNMIFFVM